MTEKLLILRPGECAGCRQLMEVRQLASQQAAKIAQLERQIVELRTVIDGAGGSAPDRRVQRRLFETPSIGELPLGQEPRR